MSKSLYRDPVNGKIAGVCAGLADFFSLDVNLVRVVVVACAIFSMGFLVFLAYVAAVLIIEKKPAELHASHSMGTDANGRMNQRNFSSPSERLANLEQQLQAMEVNIVRMEAYVTSTEFDLSRKFKQL